MPVPSLLILTYISDSNEKLFCTVEEVLEMLCTLDTSKATGPDGISVAMVKATAESTTGNTAVFNKCIASGKVPKDRKVSAVAPIPKGDDSNKPITTDLRISLLSILSKLLERHMHKIIYNHLEYCSTCFTTMGILYKKVNCVCTDLCNIPLVSVVR